MDFENLTNHRNSHITDRNLPGQYYPIIYTDSAEELPVCYR